MRTRAAVLLFASLVVSCTAPATSAPLAAPSAAPVASAPATVSAVPSTGAASPTPDATPATGVLTVISDRVTVGRGGSFTAAADGDLVRSGDTVRTEDGRAVLTFIDGSTVEIEPASELVVDTLAETKDSGVVVALTQLLGHTWHVVSKLAGSASYLVRTPASTAVVRGTAFEVGVEVVGADPVATIQTHEGAVATTAVGKTDEVLVREGSLTTVKKGDARPAPPRAAPPPERKATVTIGDTNSVVVDTFGRANGIRDGRPVLQTPGAKLEIKDGRLVITLPAAADGRLTTVVGKREKDSDAEDVDVETKVEDKEGRSETVKQKIARGKDREGTGGVDVKTGSGRPSIAPLASADPRATAKPKIGKLPERPSKGRDGSPKPQATPSARPAGTQLPIRTPERSEAPRLLTPLPIVPRTAEPTKPAPTATRP